jgi:hypothetical protein
MGEAIDHLKVLFAKAFIPRHKSVSATGKIEDVEAHWRDLPPSVRKTFKESMHAPTVQGGQSHPFDTPDARPLKDLSPGERAVYEAVQQNVGKRKAEALKAKVGEDTRSAGYLREQGRRVDAQGRWKTRVRNPVTQETPHFRSEGPAKVPTWLKPGKRVQTPDGPGTVGEPVGTNLQEFFVEVDGIEDEYSVEDLKPFDAAAKEAERKARLGYQAGQRRQSPPHAPA